MSSRKRNTSRSLRQRLVDPKGEYKIIKKVIATDCCRQKCIIAFDRVDDLDDKGEDYPVSSITIKLIGHSYEKSFTQQDIQVTFLGIKEIALYISEIPTRSALLIKTENQSADEGCVEQKFYSSLADLNQVDPSVFQGLASRNTFRLAFNEFDIHTSEFSFNVWLLRTAVLEKHIVSNLPSKRSKFIIDALEFVFKLKSEGRDPGIPQGKRNEDTDWFYGQLKKFREAQAENLPRAPFNLQHPNIVPTLREYQKEAVSWMLCRENVIPSFDAGAPGLIHAILDRMFVRIELQQSHEETGVSAFFNPFVGYVCLERPTLFPMPKGGILADEMGLGKTVEMLSLIMLNPKSRVDQEEDSYHSRVKVKRGSSPCEFETKNCQESPKPVLPVSRKRRHADSQSEPDESSKKIFRNSELVQLKVGAMEEDAVIAEKEEDSVPILEPKRKSSRKQKGKRRQKKKGNKGFSRSNKYRKPQRKPDFKYMDSDESAPEERVPETPIKMKTYDRVKSIYDAALGEFNGAKHATVSHKFHGEFFNPHVGRKAFFECHCGEGLEGGSAFEVATCSVCSSSQHKACVGIDSRSTTLESYLCPHCASAAPPIPTKTTLIVTPNTIARQWIKEIRRHVKKEHMKILYYKGVAKHGYVPPEVLSQYDLIITTYGVLSTELNYVDLPHSNSADGRRFRNPKRFLTTPSPLPSILWWRVCLDEAQMVEGISSRMSSMALKLQAEHYWCVTGTPINKGLQDLFGLFVFLGIVPFQDAFWWNTLVTNPFYRKDVTLLYELFGTLIWRNGKRDVLDQLGIPPQTQIVHFLDFSPIESHFYKRLYSVCGTRVLDKVQKICQHSQQGLTKRLSDLDRKTLHEVLAPFLELRQACCHPQLVRGHTFAIKNLNETLTMEELLTQLIQKTKTQCGEDHRLIVSSLNGAAGIHWLLDEYVAASNKYREILQLSAKHEKLFTTDTLQMLHTLENLADLLDMNCPRVPYTLRDDTLRTDAELLRVKYLENHATGVSSTSSSVQKATTIVNRLQDEFLCKDESWWVNILYYAVRNDKWDDLMSRIKDDLAIYASKKKNSGSLANKFRGPSSFQAAIIEKITELDSLRATVLQNLEELLSINPSSFVDSCVACHLRAFAGTATHDFRCRLCLNFEKFSDYQHALFSEDKGHLKDKVIRTGRNRQKLKIMGNLEVLSPEEERLALLREEEELMETTGHVGFNQIHHDTKMLRESDAEKALRQLLSFGRMHKVSENALQDGSTHIKLYDSLKKEFKVLRLLWSKIFDQVSAFDELSQATTRISIRNRLDSPAAGSSSAKPKALTNWEQERAKKIQTVNLFSHHELRPKLQELELEYATALSEFNTHHGQLLYLHQLEKKEYRKANEDDCPICHLQLGMNWCVLICGHSYCSECIKRVCHHPSQSFLCPLCRQGMKMSDISFVDISAEERPSTSGSSGPTDVPSASGTHPDRFVRGSHSTKVKAVVEQLFQLQLTHPGEKVIIFSSWTVVLDIIGRALEQNGIFYSGINSGNNKGNFQKALTKFQEKEIVQVLLLPLTSGSKGLNIIEATHVFLVEPILNLASEQQAIGRIHRIGQTKPTFVHRFYVRNTIEEHLFEILKSHDVSSDEEGLLSLGDLKQLVTK